MLKTATSGASGLKKEIDPSSFILAFNPGTLMSNTNDVIDGTDYVAAKMKAMAAHPTQIELDGPFFALSNNLGNQVWGHEYYTLVKGEKSSSVDDKEREVDLFA